MCGGSSGTSFWAAMEYIKEHKIGKDKRTSHERIRGKTCVKALAMFGEKVLYLPAKSVDYKEEKVEPDMGMEEAAKSATAMWALT